MTDRIDTQLSADAADRLDHLFRTYSARVLGLARRHADVRADADDIAGRVWLAVTTFFARGGQLLAADRAWPWLATITRREAGHLYRPRRASEKPTDFTDPGPARSLPAARAAEDIALDRLVALLEVAA